MPCSTGQSSCSSQSLFDTAFVRTGLSIFVASGSKALLTFVTAACFCIQHQKLSKQAKQLHQRVSMPFELAATQGMKVAE